MTEADATAARGPRRERRSHGLRLGVFAGVSAVLGGLVSLLPPGADDEAIFVLVVVGILGGSRARSAAEVLALVAGGVTGALLVGVATFGGPSGPSSTGSLLFGVAMVAMLLAVPAAFLRWLAEQFGPGAQGRGIAHSDAGPAGERAPATSDEAGDAVRRAPETYPIEPGRAARPPVPYPTPASRARQWRTILAMFGTGILMLGAAVVIIWARLQASS